MASGAIKKATGITGLAVVPNAREILCGLYAKIGAVLQQMPKDAAYRTHTQQIVQQRLQIVQAETSISGIEQKIDCGQVEELIEQAERELALAHKMVEWEPWQPLTSHPPPNQWNNDDLLRMREIEMELAEEKEQEARQLRCCYVDQLQARASQARDAVREEQLLRQQLRADFEYNLHLLEERDGELAKYEAAVVELRQAVNHLTAENSELKVSLSGSECAISREKEQHRQKMASLQTQMEQWRRGHMEEVEGEQRRCLEVRRELEEKLRDVEGEVERVRLEVTAHFEEDIHRTKQQHRTQVEQLESAVLLSQSQVKTKERELEQVKHHLLATQEEARRLRERVDELERQSKAKEWAWQDRLMATETELGKVKGELEHNFTTSASTQSQLQHKCSELDRQVREKALCLQMAREAWTQRETELEFRVQAVEEEGVRVERERREEREQIAEQLGKKELVIERLKGEMVECREKEEEKERVLTDTAAQLLCTREEMNQLQTTLNFVTSDLHKAEESVRRRAEREGVLEREWRERVREAERRASARSQTALKMLTQDRDKVTSEVRALKKEMTQHQKSIDDVARERDVAIATLKNHNLYQQYLSEVKGHATESSESCDLQSREVLSQQNQQLRTVIAAMSRELEQLSVHITGDSADYRHGYISHLESELVRVKTENRRLRAESHRPPAESHRPPAESHRPPAESHRPPAESHRPPAESHRPPTGRQPFSSRQLLALTEALAVVQKEKTAVETRVVWLQQTLAAVQASLREREEEVYQLRALQVPPQKCQEKLLQATRSIISLLRDRDSLLASLGGRMEVRRDEGGGMEARRDEGGRMEVRRDEGGGLEVRRDEGGGMEVRRDEGGGMEARRDKGGGLEVRRDEGGGMEARRDEGGGLEVRQDEGGGSGSKGPTGRRTSQHHGPKISSPSHPHTSTSPPQATVLEQNSLSSLHFSDSEVEGQRSLDKLLQVEDIFSSHSEKQTQCRPSHPPPEHQSSPSSHISPDGHMVAMEMHGKCMKPIPRKPYNSKTSRSHIHVSAGGRMGTVT